MLSNRPAAAAFSLLVLTACATLCACVATGESSKSSGPAPPTGQQSQPSKPAPANQAGQAAADPKPVTLSDVRETLARVYKNAVVLDVSRSPSYFVGDFDGDGSQDIAVIVKPVRAGLAEINSEVSSWILEDPRTIKLPNSHRGTQPLPPKPPPVRVIEGDLILAIVHGYGPQGWRSPEAQRAYLLRNAVGDELKKETREQVANERKDKDSLRGLRGDVISETLAGQSGFLYFTGAKYAWNVPSRDGE
jgi:hypothetical protein